MIKQTIKEDSMKALKSGDKKKVEVLRYVLSLISKIEMAMPVDQKMTSEDELRVLRKELKNKKESMEMFSKGNRADLVADMEEEIKVLSVYMPDDVGEDEVRQKIIEVMDGKSVNFGMIMSTVMKSFAGRVDGSVVSRLVKEEIDRK